MARNIITGIEAGSSNIRIMVAEQKKDGVINILGVSQKQSEGIRKGFITNIDDATRSIEIVVRSAEKATSVPIKRASIAIGGI